MHNLKLMSIFRLIGTHKDIEAFGVIPEINYIEKLEYCKICNYVGGSFFLRWDYTNIEKSFYNSNKVEVIGDGVPDVYIPMCIGGYGDVLMLLRVLPFINKKVGLVLMNPHVMLFDFLLKCTDICSIIYVDEAFCNMGWKNFRSFLFENKSNIKTINFEDTISFKEIQKNYPIFKAKTISHGFDIIIHRRNINHNIGKNFTETQFYELVNYLEKHYSVGIVGFRGEDSVKYTNDLRDMSFLEQVYVIANSKLVIDTDSVFDKIAEGFNIRNINIIRGLDQYWGFHWLFNNSYTIYTDSVSSVKINDIIRGVNLSFSVEGL